MSKQKRTSVAALSVDALIEQFDAIPDMMTSLKANVSSPRRYSQVAHQHSNSSLKMDAALRVHAPKVSESKKTSKADKKRYMLMKEQAQKVLDHLNNVSEPEQTRLLHEAAAAAHVGITKLAGDNFHGGLKGLYKHYDVDRRGRIQYDDFCDSLNLTNSGVSRDEARVLASAMDKEKTGEIDYLSILDALKEVERSSRAAPAAAPVAAPAEVEEKKSLADAVDQRVVRFAPSSSSSSSSREAAPSSSSSSAASAFASSAGLDDEKWAEKALTRSSSTASGPPPPAPRSPQRFTFEELHNPAYSVHDSAPPPPPPAPAAAVEPLVLSGGGNKAHKPPMVASVPLSDSSFRASLSSMLLPLPRPEEISRSGRGKGQYSRAALMGHLVSRDDALMPAEGPQRRMMGPGPSRQPKDHNSESLEFRASVTPYWTEASESDAKQVLEGGAEPRLHRTARRRRCSSAPPTSSPPRSRAPGTHYSYFYGNSNDSVQELFQEQQPEERQQQQRQHEHEPSDETKASSDTEASSSSVRGGSRAAEQQFDSAAALGASLRENALLTQVSGRFHYLRHILKRNDQGHSGFVNVDEFKTALATAGVRLADKQVREMFKAYAQPVQTSGVGHQDGRALSIEQFVDGMSALSRDPSKASLPGFNASDARETEERRVAKKVLYSLKRVADPMVIFKEMDLSNKGWIRPEQLRSGLAHFGAPLTEFEFKTLLDKVDVNGDGKVEIAEFDALLHSSVTDSSSLSEKRTAEARASNKRYTPSYKHSTSLNHAEESGYERLLDSKVHKQDRKQWAMLQHSLHARSEGVLRAFSAGADGPAGGSGGAGAQDWASGFTGSSADPEKGLTRNASGLREIRLDDLPTALSNAGMPLGCDDTNRLKQHLSSLGSGSDSVSLETFCSAVNLRVEYLPIGDTTRVRVSEPWSEAADGGVFCNAGKSHHGSDTVASSFFRTGEEGNLWVKGNCRRKRPYPHPELAEAPHRWLELSHASTGDLWPTQPRGETFFRGTLAVHDKMYAKSVSSPAKSMRRMSAVTHKNESSLISYMGDYTLTGSPQGQGGGGGKSPTPMLGRSRSVPPTSRHAASASASASAAPGAGAVPPELANKFASKALVAFMEQKANMGHNDQHPSGTQTPVGVSRSHSKRPAPQGTPLSTSQRLNLPGSGAGAGAGSGAGASSSEGPGRHTVSMSIQPIRSLRRISSSSQSQRYGPASSPFATDLTTPGPSKM